MRSDIPGRPRGCPHGRVLGEEVPGLEPEWGTTSGRPPGGGPRPRLTTLGGDPKLAPSWRSSEKSPKPCPQGACPPQAGRASGVRGQRPKAGQTLQAAGGGMGSHPSLSHSPINRRERGDRKGRGIGSRTRGHVGTGGQGHSDKRQEARRQRDGEPEHGRGTGGRAWMGDGSRSIGPGRAGQRKAAPGHLPAM